MMVIGTFLSDEPKAATSFTSINSGGASSSLSAILTNLTVLYVGGKK